jgi:sulfite exporter TauE/SafE
MPSSAYLSLLLLGLLGGGHCGAMCGGFIAALSRQASSGSHPFRIQLAYSFGRISSYSFAGALGAGFAGLGVRWFDVQAMRMTLYVVANLLLLSAGVALFGLGTPASWLERLGSVVWKRLQPVTRFVFPANTVPRAVGAGLVWGWLPCGLVYSALGVALLSANATEGAMLMLAFGAGTLPAILGFGILSRHFFSRPSVRRACGVVIISLGLVGLAHAAGLFGQGAQGILCHL